MFNPLVDNFNQLSDAEVESKSIELQRKYFMTHNPQVQEQISAVLNMYQAELQSRRAISYQRQQNDEKGLDNLINVS